MISANRIVYNGLSSIDLDLIVDVAFDSDDGDTSTFLNREAVASESYKGEFKRVYGYKYNEVFTPTFTFVKKDFSEFSFQEQRKVLSWLTSKSSAGFLTVYYDDSNVISWEALGGFVECESYKISNGQTVGFVATFESISPYAYSELKSVQVNVAEPTTITINCQSDVFDSYVYPRVIINEDPTSVVVNIDNSLTEMDANDIALILYDDNYVRGTVYRWTEPAGYEWFFWRTETENVVWAESNSSGFDTTGVTISNETLGIKTSIGGNILGETVVIDGANRLAYSGTRNNRILGDDFKWTWIPLVTGENRIKIIGNCTVTFEWRDPIKIGEF